MPYSDPEKQKAYQKKYREDPEVIAKEKAYRQTPEFKANKKQINKIYRQTPAGIKSTRITNWKRKGVICDDFDILYEKYLNTEFCEECKSKLTEDRYNTSTTRCLDHCHATGEFRNVLCHSCNVKRK